MGATRSAPCRRGTRRTSESWSLGAGWPSGRQSRLGQGCDGWEEKPASTGAVLPGVVRRRAGRGRGDEFHPGPDTGRALSCHAATRSRRANSPQGFARGGDQNGRSGLAQVARFRLRWPALSRRHCRRRSGPPSRLVENGEGASLGNVWLTFGDHLQTQGPGPTHLAPEREIFELKARTFPGPGRHDARAGR